jgi:hypothetical protein
MKYFYTVVIQMMLGVFISASLFSQTATMPSGSGTNGDPYLVSTLDNLFWITQNSSSWGSYFVQTADIDASSTSGWNSGSGFTPIGFSGTNFSGTYDGGGYDITGLFINRSGTYWVGMFGTTENATVKNLRLVNVNITGNLYVGGLVGNNYASTIDNCSTSGIVSSSAYEVGGLVGLSNSSGLSATISNCYSSATVTGGTSGMVGGLVGLSMQTIISNCYTNGIVIDTVETWARAGGLVGESDNSIITNCYVAGNVISVNYVGGFVGYNHATLISDSYSAATVHASSYSGGFVGFNTDTSSISNCYSIAQVTTSGSNVGGFAGYNLAVGSTIAQIENCYSNGTVSGSSNVGGLVGTNSGTVSNSFWNTDSAGSTGIALGTTSGASGATTAAMKDPLTFGNAGWDSAAWYIGSGFNNGFPFLKWQNSNGYPMVTTTAPSGSGTSVDPYRIESLNNLAWLQNGSNSSAWDKYFKQTADIDASSTSLWNSAAGFSPIGNTSVKFSGTYNGNGNIITGLTSNGGLYVGMFGLVNGATIENLGLVNESISGSQYVGGIVGYCYGSFTLSKCFTTGTVYSGSYWSGGLVGNHTAGTISNCYSFANVSSGSNRAGGLVGENSATITNCYSAGVVSAAYYVGGLAGLSSGSVNNSFWDTQTSGQSTSPAGTGKTTSEMTTYSTFSDAGWDFLNTWGMHSAVNIGYPYLKGVTEITGSGSSAPTAVTSAASNISTTSAQVNGAVNSNSDTATVRFLYGTSSGSYTDSITASQSPLVPWDSINVSSTISGLSPSTTYYVRVDASSSLEYVRGAEVSFTTNAVPTLSIGADSLLTLNGSTQYVSVPDNSTLRLTDNVTLEAWVYPTKSSGNMTIVDKGNYNYLFNIKPNGQSGLGLYNAGWGWIYSSGTVPLNQWSHVAVVFQTGTNGVKFYLNGTLLSQHTATGALTTNAGAFAIGKQAPGTCDCNFFEGKIDEVRVWSVARTAQQIRETIYRTLTGTESGLISYWQFNEGAGTTAADSVGGNHGTLVDSPAWATSPIPVGGGTSSSTSSFTSGTIGIGTVTLTTSDAFDNAVDITATQINTAPNSLPATSSTELNDRYWVVNAFGTPGTFSTSLAFVVPSTFTNNGTASVSSYNLYKRNSTSDGSWILAVSGASRVAIDTVVFDGITSFSQFTIGTDDPLPVEIASLNIQYRAPNVELRWKTASEVNNTGWEIQRLEGKWGNGSIGEWVRTGFVEGGGTSNSPKEYSFDDRNLKSGTYSYRLKQIDRDGKFKYSQNVEVHVGSVPNVFALEQNYPNPFNPATMICFTLEKPGLTTLKVFDAIGREVATLVNESLDAGVYHQKQFDGSTLSSGIYIVRLQNNGAHTLKKMMLLK